MASHLLPLDLLQMSRTSRAIRHILMSKRSVFVWQRALKNHPTPLPDLEQHPFLNEPQFFALVFDQYCQVRLRRHVKPVLHHNWHQYPLFDSPVGVNPGKHTHTILCWCDCVMIVFKTCTSQTFFILCVFFFKKKHLLARWQHLI